MPQPDKPEKISIDIVAWNSQAQAFEIGLSSRFGTATAGDAASFTISTVLQVGGVATLRVESPLEKADPSDTGDGVRLKPQRIPWDRNAGAFFGAADVTTTSEVRNPSGATIGDGTATRSDLGLAITGPDR